MTSLRRFVAVVLAAAFLANVASSTSLGLGMGLKVRSKAEIMAHMTSESAVQTLVNMSRMHDKPELIALIQTKFGHMLKRGTQEQAEQEEDRYQDDRGGSGEDTTIQSQRNAVSELQTKLRGSASGASRDQTATELLNTMTEETQGALEEEVFRCHQFASQTDRRMDRMRDAVSDFNAQAAGARSRVLRAQGEIGTLNINIKHTEEEFQVHKRECLKDLQELGDQLKIVRDDIQVMSQVLALTQCAVDGDSATTPTSPTSGTSLFLVQCNHCKNAVMIQHGPIQSMLSNLQSQVARDYAQNGLALSYEDSLNGQDPVALTQTGVEHIRHVVRHRKRSVQRHNAVAGPVNALRTSDVPVAPEPVDCQPTTKCTIGTNTDCKKLRDRFLVVQTAAVDKKEELQEEIRTRQGFCEEQSLGYTKSLEGMQNRLREERTNLAVATEEQNQAESSSHREAEQHEQTAKEYTRTMKKCCDNQNTAKSELCALEKIRDELIKLKNGNYVEVLDCDLSDWREEGCTVLCGGGTLKKVRSIVVHPANGGAKCPPLEATEPCNEEECPVDCVVGDWGSWSDCSAQCGGGVQEKVRRIIVDAAHSGEPCEDTEEEASCNVGSCDVDCELAEWTVWSSCSKACGGGTLRRTRSIVTEAHGSGQCWDPEDDKRLQFMPCNAYSCTELLPDGRDVLTCKSKIDMVVLLDGSASLQTHGWEKSKAMAKTLIENLEGGDDKVQVALEVFSGPSTWANYYACTQDASATVNMKDDCGIQWVEEGFVTSTDGLASKLAALEFPASTTLTSVALGQAESMLVNGREDANSVVVVFTDGWPMSQYNTKAAAKKLQEKARLVWVPVGYRAPIGMIKELASKPEAEHIIPVGDFDDLASSDVINKVLSTVCPKVE